MVRFKSYSFLMLAGFLLFAAPNAARASQAVVGARPISALTADERLHLPGSTNVVVNGHTITLDAIRAAHDLRVRAFEGATALGRSVGSTLHAASQITDPSTLQAFKTTDHEVRYKTMTPGVYVGVIGVINHPMTPVHSVVPIKIIPITIPKLTAPIPIPQSTLQKYAKDYQDFCTAAVATACIYLPAVQSWQVASSSNIVNNQYTLLSVLDPLITDTGLCKSGGGSMSQSGCVYTYPYVETTDFTPSSSNPYASDCLGGSNSWNIAMDAHGAVSVYPYYGAWPVSATATCVVQVWS